MFGGEAQVADRRRRADLDQPRLDRRGARRPSTARLAEAGATARTETRRDADDGAAGGSVEGGGEDGRAAGRAAGLSAVRHASMLTGGQPYSHALLAGPRRARPARAADGARRHGRRPDRRSARRRSRFAASLASEPGRRHRRVQPRPARAHRLRRPRVDRAARLRQPRASACCSCRAPDERIEPLVTDAARAISGTSSSTRGRIARPRIRSAAISTAPRTT